MVDEKIKLSIKQLSEMNHCCGNDPFKVFGSRNYFNTIAVDESWEELFVAGLATKNNNGPEGGGWYYSLTDKGYEVLKKVFQEFKVLFRCGNPSCDNPPTVFCTLQGMAGDEDYYCQVCQEHRHD